ncbi:MAG: pentapeptide repeat-containing protein, partial [Cyanobacteria bacterium CAN_BIN43]|nr:pentapeptide repeat-containing protein [Cyanobacteria bacterium CAN_BIN43]
MVSSPEQIGWTGFKEDTEVSKTEKILENGKEITVVTKNVSGKTLWDWLSVLGVPLSLALLGFWFQNLSNNQANLEKEIAESYQREDVLQGYFDRLASLLVDKNLLAIAIKQDTASEEERELLSSAVTMIRARTLSILRKFGEDGGRKTSVIQFLMEAKIIRNLNLSLEGAYLVNADLSDADFRSDYSTLLFRESINLTYANFSNANLKRVIFSDADLRGAIFNNADLSNAEI